MMYKKSDVDPSNDEISVGGKSRIQNYVTRNCNIDFRNHFVRNKNYTFLP